MMQYMDAQCLSSQGTLAMQGWWVSHCNVFKVCGEVQSCCLSLRLRINEFCTTPIMVGFLFHIEDMRAMRMIVCSGL